MREAPEVIQSKGVNLHAADFTVKRFWLPRHAFNSLLPPLGTPPWRNTPTAPETHMLQHPERCTTAETHHTRRAPPPPIDHTNCPQMWVWCDDTRQKPHHKLNQAQTQTPNQH
ncbi:hypothetical protein GCM10009537_10020 [Corynebacterium riegelii]